MADAENIPDEKPATLIEQTGDVPETVVPENAKDAVEPDEAAEQPVEAKEEAAEPEAHQKRTPWYQKRIDEITKARRDAEREVAELRAKLAKPDATDEGEVPAFDPRKYEQEVQTAAERIVAQREIQRRTDSFLNAGNKEYGDATFLEKCNEVAMMGAGDSPEFMSIITDPDIIPDGHRLVAQLADHPEEAEKILALRNNPVRMAAALSRFANTVKAPEKAVSGAPAPIKTIGGAAKSSTPEDQDDIKTWMAKRNAQLQARNRA